MNGPIVGGEDFEASGQLTRAARQLGPNLAADLLLQRVQPLGPAHRLQHPVPELGLLAVHLFGVWGLRFAVCGWGLGFRDLGSGYRAVRPEP